MIEEIKEPMPSLKSMLGLSVKVFLWESRIIHKSIQTKTPYHYGVPDKNKLKLKQTDKSHKVRREKFGKRSKKRKLFFKNMKLKQWKYPACLDSIDD